MSYDGEGRMAGNRSFLSKRSFSLFAVAAFLCVQAVFAGTPLDDYVNWADPSFTYSVHSTIPGPGYTARVISMTSQTWRNPLEVDRTRWDHWLTVVEPDTVSNNQGMLLIGGGSNGDAAPTATDPYLTIAGNIAVASNSVVSYLTMVPNQPLRFADEGYNRQEDAIIAYSWDKFMDSYVSGTPDGYWPAQLPMTKSAVRAMDTIQNLFAASGTPIESFVVSGASKRGWTTWLTGAVDPRVSAIIPMVIDILNVEQSMQHHYDSYGFWAPAVNDYVAAGVMDRLGSPESAALMDIIDPYEYRDRLTMPKYMINSTGDEFFLPDSSQFYYDDLVGKKYLRYVPNTSHSLMQALPDVVNGLATFYMGILDDSALPEFSWTMEADGSITVEVVSVASLMGVSLWQATNPDARDFRLEVIGSAWTSSPLLDQGGGVYVANVARPDQGWSAFMVELIFDSGRGQNMEYKFTTQVSVIPEPVTLVMVGLGMFGLFNRRRLQ